MNTRHKKQKPKIDFYNLGPIKVTERTATFSISTVGKNRAGKKAVTLMEKQIKP
jgi:hypothetical protein